MTTPIKMSKQQPTTIRICGDDPRLGVVIDSQEVATLICKHGLARTHRIYFEYANTKVYFCVDIVGLPAEQYYSYEMTAAIMVAYIELKEKGKLPWKKLVVSEKLAAWYQEYVKYMHSKQLSKKFRHAENQHTKGCYNRRKRYIQKTRNKR